MTWCGPRADRGPQSFYRLRMHRLIPLVVVLAACSAPSGVSTTEPAPPPPTSGVVTTSTSETPTAPSSLPPTTTMLPPTPEPFDPEGASILELQAAMDAGSLTVESLATWSLARIAALDGDLRALVTVAPDVLEQARALDAERTESGPRGPLHGIPVVVKDNIATFDMPTTAGSAALDGWIPERDAFQVERLRAAGALIIAKANLQEWARSIHGNSSILGRTLNPYDRERNTGGSSAGTAVAVTTGMAVAGLGTDTCGSIRVPSAYASLWGLRPTIGLSSRDGVIPLSPSEDTVGPMARTVGDLALLLDATVGFDSKDPVTEDAAVHVPGSYLDAADPGGLAGARIGVVRSLFGAPGPVTTTIDAALARMEAAGAVLVPVEIPGLPALLSGASPGFLTEWGPATEEFFRRWTGAPVTSLAEVVATGRFLPETRERLVAAAAVTTTDTPAYRAALSARDAVAEAVTAVLDSLDLDALAYPTVSEEAAPLGVDQAGNNCSMASVGGLPAMSVPAGATAAGLPVGIDLLARAWAEPTLIRLAAGYEATVDPRVPPPSPGP